MVRIYEGFVQGVFFFFKLPLLHCFRYLQCASLHAWNPLHKTMQSCMNGVVYVLHEGAKSVNVKRGNNTENWGNKGILG